MKIAIQPLAKRFKPTCSLLFSNYQPDGVKLLVRLRLGFTHLREYKFRHNFHDSLNPLCPCSLERETTLHYLLCCHNFCSPRLAFRKKFSTDSCFAHLTDYIMKDMDKGRHTGIILIDMKKAFDTLDHDFLLKKWNM